MPEHAALIEFLDRVDPLRTLVASDFDGTLAAIVPVPADSAPLPGALEALEALRACTLEVAIISGRSQADLSRMLPVPGIRLLGDYGQPSHAHTAPAGLAGLVEELRGAVAEVPGASVELKPASASVHFRANPPAGAGLRRIVEPRARAHGLEVRQGRLVLELVPAGWDKRRALEALVGELDPGAVVFAGDDHGDRGCFTYMRTLELPHLAIGVVSDETPDSVFEDCDMTVAGPLESVALFRRLAAEWARPAPGRAGPAPAG